ncbi:hypothetical protein PF008_g12395 [Phytophthora fragariae]|uniref:Uncharacterized protein n=1 Tax=Phytophthora fragariae TaxID=53985 RepID=A0A6G0RNX0_9STRA|nr:hypothetical protein PF008_g12395 [Phytophthora fragariae]
MMTPSDVRQESSDDSSDSSRLERRRAQSRTRQLRYLERKRQYERGLLASVDTLQSEVRSLQSQLDGFRHGELERCACPTSANASLPPSPTAALPTSSILQTARDLVHCFRSGFAPTESHPWLPCASPTQEQVRFVQQVVHPDVSNGELRGQNSFLEQWRRYTAFFGSLALHPQSFSMLPGNVGHAVCQTQLTLSLLLESSAFQHVFPHLLQPQHSTLLQRLSNQQLHVPMTLQLQFDALGRSVQLRRVHELRAGLAPAARQLRRRGRRAARRAHLPLWPHRPRRPARARPSADATEAEVHPAFRPLESTSASAMAGKQSPMRMFIMLPMIFLMGKIDFENETILTAARTAFFVCQATALLVGLYLKQLIERKHDTRKIFVPGPKSPFDQSPNYAELTETTYEAHELAKAKEFLKQTLIGAGISSLIHFKMGVNHVVMIQSVMMPMNLWDNPLVQAYLLGRRNGRIWNERLEGESAEEAAAAAGVDAPAAASATPAVTKKESEKVTPEEAIAAALAAGADADFDALWTAVKAKVNAKTDEDQWTALMVACGSPVDTDDFIKKVVNAGADVLAVDGDGWTALHWSAFHGRPEAAEALLSSISAAKLEQLLAVKAVDGRTAAEVAKGEENGDVVDVLTSFSSNGADKKEEDATLRQRKAGASSVEDVD